MEVKHYFVTSSLERKVVIKGDPRKQRTFINDLIPHEQFHNDSIVDHVTFILSVSYIYMHLY